MSAIVLGSTPIFKMRIAKATEGLQEDSSQENFSSNGAPGNESAPTREE
jgi:hypothetical protein